MSKLPLFLFGLTVGQATVSSYKYFFDKQPSNQDILDKLSEISASLAEIDKLLNRLEARLNASSSVHRNDILGEKLFESTQNPEDI